MVDSRLSTARMFVANTESVVNLWRGIRQQCKDEQGGVDCGELKQLIEEHLIDVGNVDNLFTAIKKVANSLVINEGKLASGHATSASEYHWCSNFPLVHETINVLLYDSNLANTVNALAEINDYCCCFFDYSGFPFDGFNGRELHIFDDLSSDLRRKNPKYPEFDRVTERHIPEYAKMALAISGYVYTKWVERVNSVFGKELSNSCFYQLFDEIDECTGSHNMENASILYFLQAAVSRYDDNATIQRSDEMTTVSSETTYSKENFPVNSCTPDIQKNFYDFVEFCKNDNRSSSIASLETRFPLLAKCVRSAIELQLKPQGAEFENESEFN